jgi:hypothetical protein
MGEIERVTTTLVKELHSENGTASKPSSFLSRLDIEKLAPWLLAVFICYGLFRNFFESAHRFFWYDEVCTWVMVRQPNLSTMWRALAHGVDGQPPGYYVIERVATHLSGNEQISFRIPSILAFSFTIVCLFLFIKRRSGAVNALLFASIPLFSILFDTYAMEARPYALVMACISFALICYQHVPNVRWTILLGVSLALAQALHYFAVIIFVPFFAAEAVFYLKTRRLRLGVWIALACGFLPLACFGTLLFRFKALYSAHYWSLPSLKAAEACYSWFFNTTFTLGAILAAGAVLAILGRMLVDERRKAMPDSPSTDLVHEQTLALGLVLVPFLAFLMAKLAHGGFTSRYALSGVLGFSLVATYVFPAIKSRALGTFSILLLLLAFTFHEHRFWTFHKFDFNSPAVSAENLVLAAGHPDLPFVVSDSMEYSPLIYYASPEWRKRFVMLVDPPEAVKYVGNDSNDIEMKAMRDYGPFQVYDFQPFAAQHPTFVLYSSFGGFGGDWWVPRLYRDGYKFQLLVKKDYWNSVYLVTRPDVAKR